MCLRKMHGICDIPARNGHFNLMEYKGVELRPEFEIIKIVCNG